MKKGTESKYCMCACVSWGINQSSQHLSHQQPMAGFSLLAVAQIKVVGVIVLISTPTAFAKELIV